MKKPL
jgi:titin